MTTSLIVLIRSIISLYIWLVIIVVLIDMIKPGLNNPMLNAFRGLVYPPLRFIREKMPFVVTDTLDFSPLVLIFALEIFINLLLR
ncbi:MAG: YggT family protein [Campylobacterales bacterium]|nr:YggT family protein [Campylobacterales bacterium]